EEKWGRYGMGVPLIVLTSPYRSLLGPLTKYVDNLQNQGENHVVTIVLPEFIPAKWWQLGLHNQTAFLIKGAMLFRKNVIVTDVPYPWRHCRAPSIRRPARGRAALWYTRKPRDHSMKIVLAPDGPLDASGTLARYHLWGEDPTNRVGDGVFRRVLRHGGRLVPYEVRWSGPV